MAIDYTLEIPCEPKRKLGVEGLSDRLRLLEDLQTELDLNPEQMASVREVVFELRPLAFHCAKCPANHRNREFGCFGRVETPISEEAEDWLADLLPDALTAGETDSRETKAQAGAASRLVQSFQKLSVSGRSADTRRPKKKPADPEALFEGRKGLSRKYGKIFRRSRLSTSQLLEAMLFREAVPPDIAELVCRALGVWQDGGEADDGVAEVLFTQPIEGDDDTTVAQLKLFLHACMVASSLNAKILTEIHAPAGRPSAGCPV